MKRVIILFVCCVIFFFASAIEYVSPTSNSGAIRGSCDYVVESGGLTHTFSLRGKVRVVTDEAPDINVYVAKYSEGADLIVKWVDSRKYYCCGEWQLVESGEDFTIRFIDDYWFADIVIKYGEPCDVYDAQITPF